MKLQWFPAKSAFYWELIRRLKSRSNLMEFKICRRILRVIFVSFGAHPAEFLITLFREYAKMRVWRLWCVNTRVILVERKRRVSSINPRGLSQTLPRHNINWNSGRIRERVRTNGVKKNRDRDEWRPSRKITYECANSYVRYRRNRPSGNFMIIIRTGNRQHKSQNVKLFL